MGEVFVGAVVNSRSEAFLAKVLVVCQEFLYFGQMFVSRGRFPQSFLPVALLSGSMVTFAISIGLSKLLDRFVNSLNRCPPCHILQWPFNGL